MVNLGNILGFSLWRTDLAHINYWIMIIFQCCLARCHHLWMKYCTASLYVMLLCLQVGDPLIHIFRHACMEAEITNKQCNPSVITVLCVYLWQSGWSLKEQPLQYCGLPFLSRDSWQTVPPMTHSKWCSGGWCPKHLWQSYKILFDVQEIELKDILINIMCTY